MAASATGAVPERISAVAVARTVTALLVLPHGFTLSMGGTVAILTGERGYPGWLGIWLFVCGANVALVLSALCLSRRSPSPGQPLRAEPMFNIAPLVTVASVHLLTAWISSDRLAFTCAGSGAVVLYVLLVTVLLTVAGRTSRSGLGRAATGAFRPSWTWHRAARRELRRAQLAPGRSQGPSAAERSSERREGVRGRDSAPAPRMSGG